MTDYDLSEIIYSARPLVGRVGFIDIVRDPASPDQLDCSLETPYVGGENGFTLSREQARTLARSLTDAFRL